MKIPKKCWGQIGGGGGGGQDGGGQGGCVRRSKIIVKIHKKIRGKGVGGREDPVGGVRVDVNEDLKLL